MAEPDAPKPAKHAGGRPRAAIDPETVEHAAAIGCTVDEIAAIIGIGARTLQDRLVSDQAMQESIDRGRATGRATLRRLQWQGANNGNPTMLIWLGKQMLGQRDHTRIENQQLDKDGNPADPLIPAVAITITTTDA